MLRVCSLKRKGPAHRLYAEVTLNEHCKVEAFLDTGAEITLMTLPLFEQLQKEGNETDHPVTLQSSNLNFTAYGSDQPQNLLGAAFIQVAFQGITLTHPVYVASHHHPTLLIGMDLLNRLQPVIDCAQNIIWGRQPPAESYDLTEPRDICICTLGWVSPCAPKEGLLCHASPTETQTPLLTDSSTDRVTLTEEQYHFGPEIGPEPPAGLVTDASPLPCIADAGSPSVSNSSCHTVAAAQDNAPTDLCATEHELTTTGCNSMPSQADTVTESDAGPSASPVHISRVDLLEHSSVQ